MPNSRQVRATRCASSGAGLGGAVLDQVEAKQQAAPAHVANRRVALLEGKHAGAQVRAQGARALGKLVADHDLGLPLLARGWRWLPVRPGRSFPYAP
jgi:hypothetical protein